MKRIMIGVIALSSVMFACNKEEIAQTNLKQNTNVEKASSGSHNRIFHMKNGKVWCDNTGGNCLNGVDVVASLLPTINDGIEVVKHGNSSQIIDFYESNQNDLGTVMGSDCVKGVINGTYAVKVNGSMDDIAYFQYYNSENKLYKAIPLKR